MPEGRGALELYFLRHGIAVERGTPGYENDADRPLTAEGESRTRDIARGIRATKASFGRILSSPYLRARQTAEIVAAETGIKIEFTRSLTPEGSPERLIQEIASEADRGVLLVGHEPYLTDLISVLIAGNPGTLIELKKGGLGKVTAESLSYGKCATLNWLLAPKLLRNIR